VVEATFFEGARRRQCREKRRARKTSDMSRLRRRLAFAIAVSGGAGLSPVWPGTAGAAVGVLIAAALVAADSLPIAFAGCALLFAAGVWAASAVCRDLGVEDPQTVVIDETFGCAAVLCCLPADPLWWAAGFLAFRLFDTVKPWPIHVVEDRVKGGLGVMLDDAAAAAMAVALLLLVRQLSTV
jgi:phosphatidylglycerophosphatase A